MLPACHSGERQLKPSWGLLNTSPTSQKLDECGIISSPWLICKSCERPRIGGSIPLLKTYVDGCGSALDLHGRCSVKKRTHRSRPIPTRTNTSTAKLGSTVLLLKIIPDVREQLLHDTSKNYAGGNLTQRWNITI